MVFQAWQWNIFTWALCASTLPVVAIRIYVRLRMRYRPYRELLLIIAFLLNLGTTITNSLMIDNDWYNLEISDGGWDPAKMVPTMKEYFANNLFYLNSIYFCKYLLLRFYGDLSPRNIYTKTWWCIAATWVISIVGATTTTLWLMTACRPFSLTFDYLNGYYTCVDTQKFNVMAYTFHLTTDVMVYLIPFAILRNVTSIDAKQKRASYLMFAAGFFNIGCAVMPVLYMGLSHQYADDTFYVAFLYIASLQSNTAIWLVCMPQIRRLYLGLSPIVLKQESMVRRHGPVQAAVIQDLEAGSSGDDTSSHETPVEKRDMQVEGGLVNAGTSTSELNTLHPVNSEKIQKVESMES